MYSVTMHPVCIASNRRRDGTYPVKIRVTFKGVSRRLPTTLIAQPGDLTRTLHIKSATITAKARDLISRMQATLADISPFTLQEWDVDRVVSHIQTAMASETFRLDFFQYADGYLAGKNATTRRAYDMALASLARHLGERRLDVNDVTRSLLQRWRDDVDGQKKLHYRRKDGRLVETEKERDGTAASARHLAKLAHIFNAAKRRYNDDDRTLIPRSPFDGMDRHTPPPTGGQRNLGRAIIQLMITDTEAAGAQRVALDAFLLSFALMGANMADLYAARAFTGNVWEYHRQKTASRRADGALMRVSVPTEVSAIIGRLQDGPRGWWLPALHRIAGRKDLCTQKVNAGLRAWAASIGVEPFTFYAARHTWASLARSRDVGIEKATVDECLCHVGDFRMTDIYAERDFALMDAANRKVLDLFKW